jgi:hypothetical protein
MFPNKRTSSSFLGLTFQALAFLVNRGETMSFLVADAWTPNPETTTTSRRFWLQQQAVTAASLLAGSTIVGLPSPAFAAGVPSPAELEKLRKGHARVQYLLDHWDEETQVCGKIIMSDLERKQVVRTEGKRCV